MFIVPVPVLSLRSEFGRFVFVMVMMQTVAVASAALLNSSFQRRSCRHSGATASRWSSKSIGEVLVQWFGTARRAESSTQAFLVLFPVPFAEFLLVMLLRRYLRLTLILQWNLEAIAAVHKISTSRRGRNDGPSLVHQGWTRRRTGRSRQPNVRQWRTFNRFRRRGFNDRNDVL